MGRNAKLRSDRRLCRSSHPTKFDSSVKPFNFFTEEEQRATALSLYPYPTYPSQNAKWEGWVEAAIELVALDDRERQGWHFNDWQLGLRTLLRGLLTMAGAADVTPEGVKLIKAAGQVLGDIGGTQEMYQTAMIWVPSRLRRLVDLCWHGIHGWKS